MEKISSISTEIITYVMLFCWLLESFKFGFTFIIWELKKHGFVLQGNKQYRFGKLTRTWITSEFSNELLIANAGMENIIRNGYLIYLI